MLSAIVSSIALLGNSDGGILDKKECHTFGLELISLCMLIKSVPFVTHWINMCAHEKTGSWFLVSLPLGDQCICRIGGCLIHPKSRIAENNSIVGEVKKCQQ